MRGDHRKHQFAHDVVAEVRRQVPDAPHGIGIAARARERSHAALARLLEPVVGPVDGKQSLLRHVEILEKREQLGDEHLVAFGVGPVERAFLRHHLEHGVAPAHPRR